MEQDKIKLNLIFDFRLLALFLPDLFQAIVLDFVVLFDRDIRFLFSLPLLLVLKMDDSLGWYFGLGNLRYSGYYGKGFVGKTSFTQGDSFLFMTAQFRVFMGRHFLHDYIFFKMIFSKIRFLLLRKKKYFSKRSVFRIQRSINS